MPVGKEYITVKNSDEQLTEHFKSKEFFNAKTGLSEHLLAKDVIQAVQAIRSFFKVPIQITSSYRNYTPTGGVDNSTHKLAQAIDFAFLTDEATANDLYATIRDDFDSRGELFEKLFDLGVRGFGSYDTFVHIDTANNHGSRWRKHEDTIYGRWNNMKTLRSHKSDQSIQTISLLPQPFSPIADVISGTIADFMHNEDGVSEDHSWKTALVFGVIGLLIVFVIIMIIR